VLLYLYAYSRLVRRLLLSQVDGKMVGGDWREKGKGREDGGRCPARAAVGRDGDTARTDGWSLPRRTPSLGRRPGQHWRNADAVTWPSPRTTLEECGARTKQVADEEFFFRTSLLPITEIISFVLRRALRNMKRTGNGGYHRL
jgi:hypothetical protein